MSWFGGKKKQKKKQNTGFPGDLSPQQQQALLVFKKHVLQSKKSQKKYDQTYLLRFLRARKFDIPKTVKMWNDFIDWRMKNEIDNFKNFKFPELPELRKLYPHGYHKVDKQFRPIYIQRVGFMDVQKIFKVMSTQNMLQYYAVLYETLLTTIFQGCTVAQIKANGENQKVTQTVTILDLKHVKLGNAGKAYDFVKPVSAMAQDNYPQILGNMFIINAPMLFTGIWAIVKMWIDDKTKQKIKILGGSYKKQLLQLIDAQNLPDFIQGGKCKCGGKQCNLQMNVGPWNPEGKQMFSYNIYGKKQIQLQSKIEEKSKQQPLLSHAAHNQVKTDIDNQIQSNSLKKIQEIKLNQNQQTKKEEDKHQQAKKEVDGI